MGFPDPGAPQGFRTTTPPDASRHRRGDAKKSSVHGREVASRQEAVNMAGILYVLGPLERRI